jgi:hypothetical protein
MPASCTASWRKGESRAQKFRQILSNGAFAGLHVRPQGRSKKVGLQHDALNVLFCIVFFLKAETPPFGTML